MDVEDSFVLHWFTYKIQLNCEPCLADIQFFYAKTEIVPVLLCLWDYSFSSNTKDSF